LLLQLDEREVVFPDGRRSIWEVASYRDAATAVAALGFRPATRDVVMVRNYRPSVGKWSLEVVGGLPLPGEALPDAAAREFREETGFTVTTIAPAGTLYSLPGIGYFPIACFIVEVGSAGPQELDMNEQVELVQFEASRKTINDAKARIDDPVTLAVLDYFLRCHIDGGTA
jgi:ADP-ribose pyrophosphatase